MAKGDSVLFVSHDAFPGGATLMLLNFLRWFKRNTDIPFHVLLCKGGQLQGEFEKLAPVWYLDARVGRRAFPRNAMRRLISKLRATNVLAFADLVPRIGVATKVGLVYSNTVANGRVLEALSPLGCPVLTHVHELEFGIHTYAGKDFGYVKRHTDHFVAVSDVTRRNLLSRHGIPAEKIECIRGFIPTILRPRADSLTLKEALAAEIGIPKDARIIGGCGPVLWLKGCDLFLQLALTIRARAPSFPVHLLWLGTKPQGDGFYNFQHDLDHAGLTECVHFIGARPNPLDYIATFDVYALVSREESLSLVMLEAATLGVPTVCFEGASGACEFVENDAGSMVPYLDVGAMADRVLELLRDDELRDRLGRRAGEKVRKRHDIDVMAPKLLRTIERMLGDGRC